MLQRRVPAVRTHQRPQRRPRGMHTGLPLPLRPRRRRRPRAAAQQGRALAEGLQSPQPAGGPGGSRSELLQDRRQAEEPLLREDSRTRLRHRPQRTRGQTPRTLFESLLRPRQVRIHARQRQDLQPRLHRTLSRRTPGQVVFDGHPQVGRGGGGHGHTAPQAVAADHDRGAQALEERSPAAQRRRFLLRHIGRPHRLPRRRLRRREHSRKERSRTA